MQSTFTVARKELSRVGVVKADGWMIRMSGSVLKVEMATLDKQSKGIAIDK